MGGGVVRVNMEPSGRLLPFLGLKRAHSASNEKQGDEKRQALDQTFGQIPYEDIVNGVVNALGPVIYVCQDMTKTVYKHQFSGRSYDGRLDNKMRIIITAQIHTNELVRTYSIQLQVHDRAGPLKIWPLMEAEGVHTRKKIRCGLQAPELRRELTILIYPWLDFTNRHFSIAQASGPLAPGQLT